MKPWATYLLFTLLCVFAQGFFSMFEMAAVSFNKVRLQYYVGQNKRLAVWLNFLLNRPSRLFGTTLIAINTVLQMGSEFSRQFYESLNLNPDLAPITQIFIVLIFGELAPMFAARRYPEHVVFLYIPIIMVVSKVLTPLIWFIDGLNTILHRLLGRSSEVPLFLSREEIQKAFEEKEGSDALNTVISNFFTLKNKTAKEVMLPITSSQLIPSESTLEEMRHILSVNYATFIPIYHKHIQNIVSIAYPRDLLEVDEKKKVIDFARPPWFITEGDSILEILKQFRRNAQSTAIVLDPSGQASGILTLDHLIDEIFGESEDVFFLEGEEEIQTYFEKTIAGEMSLTEFNAAFHTHLEWEGAETLSDYLAKALNHHPSKGEKVKVENLEIIVLETTLFGTKTVRVKTLNQ